MNSMQYIRQRELKDPLTHRNRQEISSVNPQNSYNASKKAAANILKRIYSKPHDSIFHELVKLISSLEKAIELTYWDDIEASVGDIIAKVLDTSPIMSGAGEAVSPQAKHTKELFCRLGGFQLLLKLFEPPFTPGDGRKITPALLNEKCEIWNEILLLLRELACALPGMSEIVLTDKVVVFFFTLLSQNTIFDNTMNLLEEILVSREESFLLGKIPEFYALVNKFSARQLAHFCRVLSLVIFEPEDRQIMEGAQVLRSTELLQLRKNRMAKSSSAIVEKNQSLMLKMPNFLEHLVKILRVINYGPNLADLIKHNIVSQLPITGDIIQFFSHKNGVSDWQQYDNLEKIVSEYKPLKCTEKKSSVTLNNTAAENTESVPRNGRVSIPTLASIIHSFSSIPPPSLSLLDSQIDQVGMELDGGVLEDDTNTLNHLLRAFSPQSNQPLDSNSGHTSRDSPNDRSDNSASIRLAELHSLVSIMQMARGLGVASITPLGQALIHVAQNNPSLIHSNSSASNYVQLDNSEPNYAFKKAKNELQFHAMLLSPHQIELIFVLCTLLSGRRKISVQDSLASLGLSDVLQKMFHRLSWEYISTPSKITESHIHGPGCECNPESAIRVQFLRLVHNFYDRDFLGNGNKLLILSESERDIFSNEHIIETYIDNIIQHHNDDDSPLQTSQLLYSNGPRIPEKSLLSNIIDTLCREDSDSIYRFWLSACVENFLRGCGMAGQLFVANTGLFEQTVRYIVSAKDDLRLPKNTNSNNSLQTGLDLLSEIVKLNPLLIYHFDKTLSQSEFEQFVDIILSHLVDSNVFVRSLYLSLHLLNPLDAMNSEKESATNFSVENISLKVSNIRINEINNGEVGESFRKDYQNLFDVMQNFGFYRNTLHHNPSKSPALQPSCMAKGKCYLTETWHQFHPPVLSSLAIDIHRRDTSVDQTRKKRIRQKAGPIDRKGFRYNGFHHNSPNISSIVKEKRGAYSTQANSNSNGNGISNFSNGVYSALKDIRKATTHLLKFSEANSIHSLTLMNGASNLNNDIEEKYSKNERYNPYYKQQSHQQSQRFLNIEGAGSRAIFSKDDVEEVSEADEEVGGFYTPPEEPKFHRYSSALLDVRKPSPVVQTAVSALTQEKICSSSRVIPASAPYFNGYDANHSSSYQFYTCRRYKDMHYDFASEEISSVANDLQKDLDETDGNAIIPSSALSKENSLNSTTHSLVHHQHYLSNRLRNFLENERSNIVFRLMSTVSLRTINHENICCLNTTLLILLLEHNRGNLAFILTDIRHISKEAYESRKDAAEDKEENNAQSVFCFDCSFVVDRKSCQTCQSSSSMSNKCNQYGESVSKAQYTKSSSTEDMGTCYASNESDLPNRNGSDIVMENFRELLWYWREYYLRRGRDRLSIEFSCHLPFSRWKELVDLLCQDNGSSTALLPAPIRLPHSPYRQQCSP